MRQPAVGPQLDASSAPAFTPRAWLLGAIGALIVGLGVPYGTLILRGSYMDLDFSTPGAIFVLFVFTALLNPLLFRLSRRFALSSREMLVVYVMSLMACSIPTMGLTCQLLPIITGFKYFATPENHWEDLILPHLAPWLYPQGETVVKYFYEGLPPGALLPWMAWVKPVGLWLILIFAFQMLSVCLMVILRKQWIENERLIYPLAQLPLEMVSGFGPRTPGSRPPLYRSAALWVGFAIPMLIGSAIGLHKYFPQFPAPVLVATIPTFRKSQSLIFRLSFPMIGFFYLVEQQTSFSLWFFNLLFFVVRGVMNILHVSMSENMGGYGAPNPIFAHLGTGAFLAMVIAGLRVSRRHLSQVWCLALRPRPDSDERQEMLTYRQALVGAVVSLAVMAIWLGYAGMPPVLTVPFLLVALMLFVGLTRVVCESGMAEAVAPSIAPGVVTSALGVPTIGPRGIAVMGTSFVWLSDMRIFVMATAAHGLKLAEEIPGNRRPMFWAMAGGVLLAMAASLPLTLYWSYQRGGPQLNDWFWGGGPNAAAKWVADMLISQPRANLAGWILTGVGFVIMGWLTSMRQQILWWPFHPLGFSLGGIWMMDQLWSTIFLTWLIKAGIMRYGGVKSFQRARPFFLGLILGQFACNGGWLVIDWLTGHTGNQIFWI